MIRRAASVLVFAVSFVALLGISGCVTFPGATSEETANWFKEREQLRKNLATEQNALRLTAHTTKLTKPFLWKIERDGKRSYLFGSMHQGISSNALPLSIRSLINGAATNIFESDIHAAQHFKMEPQRNKPPPLQEQLDPKAWQILHHDLMYVDPEDLTLLTPGQAHSLYLQARQYDLAPENDELDNELENMANRAKKRLVFLETGDDLKGMFQSLGAEAEKETATELNKFLLSTPLNAVKEEIASSYRLLVAYKSGDLAKIEAQWTDEKAFRKEDYALLITNRNKAWLPKLTAELDHGDAFICVGVAHMTGPSSLLKLLGAKNYKFHRLDLSELVAP